MSQKKGYSTGQASTTPKQARTGRSKDVKLVKLQVGLSNITKRRKYNLTERFPRGFKSEMASHFGVSKNNVIYVLKLLRGDHGVMISHGSNTKKSNNNAFIDTCRMNGYIRNSKKEGAVCEAISKYLIDRIPRGGHSILIGTPTPLCASNHPSFYNTLIMDNAALAYVMRISSERMTIAVGNAVDAEKAARKASDWRSLDITSGMDIITEPIHRDSFTKIISTRADENMVCKVVLLTSGVWTGSKASYDKYGLDLNFQAPSMYLTNAFSNLHIIALVADSHFTFSVHHVHRGVEKTIYKENRKEKGGDTNVDTGGR